MRVALVKQDVYADLYVCRNGLQPKDILFSSTGRVGPLGLFTLLEADFFIVKEEYTPECQIWKKIIPGYEKECRRLKTDPLSAISKLPWVAELNHNYCNGDFSISVHNINWEFYDVVISINCSIPSKIVKEYPKVLWAYMIGEANLYTDKVYFNYDVCLNQENRGIARDNVGVIDFPYTFIGPSCLENIMREHLQRTSLQNGVYAEINSVLERPVRNVPHFEPIKVKTGHSIRIHKPLVEDNLKELYDAKYYVKIGGRATRGNGIIEAISSGTVVLLNPVETGCTQLLPKEAWIYNAEDAIQKIKYLDNNEEAYYELLAKQRALLQQFIVDYPLEALESMLHKKKMKELNHKYEPLYLQELKAKVKKVLT